MQVVTAPDPRQVEVLDLFARYLANTRVRAELGRTADGQVVKAYSDVVRAALAEPSAQD